MQILQYFKPKSMVYTGEHKDIETKITHYQYDTSSYEILEDFPSTKPNKHYIQIVGLANVDKIQEICTYYKIDPLIGEDILSVNQRNKFDVKENHIFGTFSLAYIFEGKIIEDYMSILMFENVILTFHETTPVFLDPLKTLIHDHKELREHSIDYLFFQILDIITDGHLELYDVLEDEVNEFEEQLLETKNIEQESFYLIRKQLLKLKNNVSPVYEQLEKLLLKKHGLFQLENANYFEDLKDHLARLDNRLNQSSQLTRNLLDLHMNNQSTKMNKIMATLTLFSAIFIPLSFLTGIFGMNFVHFGILQYEHAVLLFGIVCLTIALTMFIFFKRKKWF